MMQPIAAQDTLRDPRRRRHAAALLLAGMALLLLAACGRKGDPLPPIRYIPLRTTDFDVRQQGSELILSLTYPQSTASGQVLPGVERVEVWRLETSSEITEIDPQQFGAGAERWIGIEGVELQGAIVGDQIRTRLPISQLVSESTTGGAFAIKTVSTTGEPSDFSNVVQLPLVTSQEPPQDVEVAGTADGVELSWSAVPEAAGYSVYRRLASERTYGEPLARAGKDDVRYLDGTARTGLRYIYAVRAILSERPLVETGASAETEIDYVDRFPPRPPQRLIGLGEDGQVRLVWEASESRDTSAYRVYRSDPTGSDFRRVIDRHPELEYVDEGLTPGLSYRYRVTALDAAGNESDASNVVTVTVP